MSAGTRTIGRPFAHDPRDPAVLCVDDDATVLAALRFALEERFTLLTAGSGDEALRILQGNDVAVLVTDQRMPAMTGADLCERARAIRPDVIRVVLTAYSDIEGLADAVNRGQITRYLRKPTPTDVLMDVIEKCVELYQARRRSREMEAALLRDERTETLATIASMHHDALRALDGVVLAIEGVCAAADEVDPPRDEAIRIRALAAAELTDLARGMLRRFSPIDDPHGAGPECDAGEVVELVVRLVAVPPGLIAVEVTAATRDRRVGIGRSELAQVLWNLLENAVEAVAGMQAPRIVVEVGSDRQLAYLAVRDNGSGMADGLRERVFVPFVTTKTARRGRGLGLTIVRQILDRRGGRIEIQSPAAGGALVIVRLPLAAAANEGGA